MSRRTRKARRAGDAAAEMLLSESSPSALKEAYKALRTNILFSFPDSKSKCIGVTSGTSAEGKSINSINLSIALSEIGKRVILVECDLRLPVISGRLGFKPAPGLTEFLAGQANSVEAIRSYNNNMHVMPCGTVPREPTFLLESDLIGRLLKKLSEIYDYIIIDLPPVGRFTDAVILARHIDGYVIVVRHEQTEYKEISNVLRQLKIADARILGFLYNDVPISSKKSYYSRGYGSGY